MYHIHTVTFLFHHLIHLFFLHLNDIMVFEKNLELVKFNFSENVELIRFEMTDKLKSLINQPVYDTELFEESKI